ncbi:MAG: hypothetical protein F7B60_06880 [Desulfurococcales archaeon]|nr:hypothetical protein [Desulfurococcales archaeon]
MTVIVIILFSYSPGLLTQIYGAQTSYLNDSCIIESKVYHIDYVIISNSIFELDNISKGAYSVKGTIYQLNITSPYFFKCYPHEYLIASANASNLNSIELRRFQNGELEVVLMKNYTLEEISIDGLSFHKRDVDYLNNTLILVRRNLVTVPLNNITIAKSLVKNGMYMRIEVEKSVVDLVIYPLEKNRENTISTAYGTNETSKTLINESLSQWNLTSKNNSMYPVNLSSLNRSLLYAITLIVSLIILLYYLVTVRKLG